MVIGSWAGGTNGATPLVVNFNANATAESVQALGRRITYENVSVAPDHAAGLSPRWRICWPTR